MTRTSFLRLLLVLSIAFEISSSQHLENTTVSGVSKQNDVVETVKRIQVSQNESNLTLNVTLPQSSKKTLLLEASNKQMKEKKKSSNINKIIEMAREERANLCSYGENPQLSQICPEFYNLHPHLTAKTTKNLTLKAVESAMLNATLIQLLRIKCAPGEWCLPDLAMPMASTKELTLISNHNEKILCLFASCFVNVQNYIEKCVKSELSQHLLHLGGTMCEFNKNKPLTNKFCSENTMRLIHLHVAATDYNHTQTNVSSLTR